ncbi:DNA ligase [Streptomyces sp. BV286]|uniref:ATP-dependent DNA ligase n=1 Tax=Streptomyces sp. BV286 TaxID=2849672 RepID=UPI001C2E6479|nr:DNA ligase [Streptomyces sp. BV286]MBV1940832.1 DNA ligase [Streptomyces sp. BV286]
MEWPVSVALAQAVSTLPVGKEVYYEPKMDGHRLVMWRTEDNVRLQTRAGRDVTSVWMDLALAGMQLPAGVVLDGEGIVYVDGRISFGAAQSRANSTLMRARALAERHPAHYAVFDILRHPEHGDTRGWSYRRRRSLLEHLLEEYGVGPPIQAVPTTTDVELARLWYEALQPQGVEGLVVKVGSSTYRGNSRQWRKIRHAETVDAVVVGYTGPAARPRHLAVRLPDGRTAFSQALRAPLAAQIAALLATAGPARQTRTAAGESFSAVGMDVVVEVLSGTTRHAVVTVTRMK